MVLGALPVKTSDESRAVKRPDEGAAIPGVSVVIPTYNRAGVVTRAIQSVLAQSYQAFEIIVVDDGSTDGTPMAVAAIQDPRIRYIRHDRNQGGGSARNAGIAAARGEYVAFLDSDDEWMPDKLERQVRVLGPSGPEIGAVCTGFVSLDARGQVRKTTIPTTRHVDPDGLLTRNLIGTTSTFVARTGCLQAIGGFDTSLASCQDWDLYARLARHFRIAFVPEALVRHHVGNGDRISYNSAAVIGGHLRLAEKYLEQFRGFTHPRHARWLYSFGTNLVGLGYKHMSSAAIRRGRELVLAAFLAEPLRVRRLALYAVSHNRYTWWARGIVRGLLGRRGAEDNPA